MPFPIGARCRILSIVRAPDGRRTMPLERRSKDGTMAWRDQGYLTVLVIDDDPELRTMVQSIVIGEGHQAIAVGSAEAGLEQLPFHSFDVAFLDQRLPGMDGIVLGEYLHRANPETEVVLVTGEPDPRLARVCAALGITIIAKPFDVDAIIEVLGRAVRRQEASQRASQRRRDGGGETRERGGPVDLTHAYPHLAELFGLPGVSHRIEDLLARRVREALERLQLVDRDDENALAVAYAGIVAAQVLGLKLPKTKSGQTYAEWFDELMAASERRPGFHDPDVAPLPAPDED